MSVIKYRDKDGNVKEIDVIKGDKPVKGVDYFNESDRAEFESFITTELAKRGQLKPEFANDISECTDTSKLYVLPDGFIYAYLYSKGKFYTNVLPMAQALDSTSVYNGSGYKDGYRLSSSSPFESAKTGYTMTGWIPLENFKGNTVDIYVKGVTLLDADTNERWQLYDSGKTRTANGSGYFNASTAECAITELATGYYKLTFNLSSSFATSEYINFSFAGSGAGVIITLNEPIEETEGYRWANTGHAFVPADYEDRIIDTESEVKALKKRVADLGAGGVNTDIESYVIDEAERVAKEVYSHQNANTFSFLAIADMHEHLSNEQIMISNTHAGQGMDLVRQKANINFGVVLGDNGWGSGIEGSEYRATTELGVAEIRSANEKIDKAFRGMPNLRVWGNHDPLMCNYTFNNNDYLDGNELFPLYGAYNAGAFYPTDEKDRGYCYRDFEDYKLRVICMNTADIKDFTPADDVSPCHVSGTQQKWLAETLDLSAKSDSAEWGIIIFSHHPLDFGSPIRSCSIIKAYIEGSSISQTYDGVTINYDYAGKNNAKIIANIHGHNHNYLVDNLRYLVDGSTTAPLDIKRICIPNACFTRSNERGQNGGVDVYDIEFGETTTYEKIAGTAEDTAFCVVTVDTAQKKIYATHYGAGVDRVISY